MKRLLIYGAALLVILSVTLTFAVPPSVYAQASEPTALIDAALRDLSSKLGVTLTRGTVSSYTWEQKVFNNAALECPAPGEAAATVQTVGFVFTFRYKDVTYDYRATNDGSLIFQCVNGQRASVVNPNATPAPTIPATAGPASSGSASPVTGLNNTSQPTTYNNPVAFVAADGNVYISDFASGAITSATPITGDATGPAINYYPYFQPKHDYTSLTWAPDGSKLAFVDMVTGTLWLARTGQKAAQVAANVAVDYPPAWSTDGGELIYAVSTGQPANPGNPNSTDTIYQLQAVPANGGSPRVVGQIPVGVGCGGGGIDSATAALWYETGYSGSRKILAAVANGFLYTSSCGGIGLGLANLTNQGTWKRADLSSPTLSPDRSKVVAIVRNPKNFTDAGSAIELVDLNTGAGTRLPITGSVTQTGWSSDGLSIFYVVQVPGAPLQTITNPVSRQLYPEPPLVQTYTIELYRYPVAGGQPIRLYSREGRGIGNVYTTPDGANVVFSFVTSLVPQVTQINNGATLEQAKKFFPRPELMVLPLNGGSPFKAVNGAHPTSAAGQFLAQPVPVLGGTAPDPNAPDALQPPTLTVGGKAVVSLKDGSLNLRASPSATASIKGFLPKGTIVTILAGPTAAEGYRWWQVQAPSGNSGWVADQVVDGGEVINTLTPQ